MKVKRNFLELIGSTPLLRLERFEKLVGAKAEIYAKLEYFNPAGSVKDRAAAEMIADAEARGVLKPGATIIEPTSGNTGIGIAAVAAVRGYRVILTMPETMSIERRKLLSAYGAEIILTEGARGMAGAVEKANELQKEIPDSIIAGQFENPANPLAHYKTTGPEIWADTDGLADIFVAGVGTGGTLSGVGRYLKEQKSDIQVVAVEPAESPVLSGKEAASHGIQGIGANFVPDALDRSVIDEILTVATDDAIAAARILPKTEGVLVGISSGAALAAAATLAKRDENAGKKIIALLPDTGERYLSTALFE
ncbi:MAG: cysteine synthase A [Clostridia bacterium]|nr:cysteine synthase A [Clostridia bacterium]